jgi:diadenylate cyclase
MAAAAHFTHHLYAVLPMVLTFLAAKTLKMYLTSKVFQMGLTALAVSIVIIFQDDFRRTFEALASWRLWGREESPFTPKLAETLVECLIAFGKNKTGALIVIQGRQSIESHVRAGIPIQGQVSGPLLASIFDPNSPGHDGGVTIVDGILDKFGVHLPLSRNSDATGRLGTRHAAALGLAEKCDALVLVVSEETGTISIARNGSIQPAKNTAALRDAIRDQSRRLRPLPHRSLFEIPWGRLAGSFGLSFVLWSIFARPVSVVQRTIEVPIVYKNLPKAWEAKVPVPARVRLTLIGPEGPVMAVDPTTLALTLNLEKVREGQQKFIVTDGNFPLPPRVRLKRIEPSEVAVDAYPTADHQAPIRVMWLKPELRAPSSQQLKLTPAAVSLRIARGTQPPKFLETEPVDIKELRRAGKLTVKIRLPHDVQMSDLSRPEIELSLK